MSNTLLAGWLSEDKFCHSDYGEANNIKNVMQPWQRSNAWRCAEVTKWVLDWYEIPYYEWDMDSGFRNKQINDHFNGSWAHEAGVSIDNIKFGKIPLKQVFNDIVSGKVKNPKGIPVIKYIDQIIYETHTGNPWIHWGVAKTGQRARNQSLMSYRKANGSVNYRKILKIS